MDSNQITFPFDAQLKNYVKTHRILIDIILKNISEFTGLNDNLLDSVLDEAPWEVQKKFHYDNATLNAEIALVFSDTYKKYVEYDYSDIDNVHQIVDKAIDAEMLKFFNGLIIARYSFHKNRDNNIITELEKIFYYIFKLSRKISNLHFLKKDTFFYIYKNWFQKKAIFILQSDNAEPEFKLWLKNKSLEFRGYIA